MATIASESPSPNNAVKMRMNSMDLTWVIVLSWNDSQYLMREPCQLNSMFNINGLYMSRSIVSWFDCRIRQQPKRASVENGRWFCGVGFS